LYYLNFQHCHIFIELIKLWFRLTKYFRTVDAIIEYNIKSHMGLCHFNTHIPVDNIISVHIMLISLYKPSSLQFTIFLTFDLKSSSSSKNGKADSMKQFCDKQSSPNAGRPTEAIADSHLGVECPSAWSRDDPSWSILISLKYSL